MIPKDIKGLFADVTLPALEMQVTVSPAMSVSYMRLVFAQCEARLMMWGDFDPSTTEDLTKLLASQWRADQLEEWGPTMIDSKRVGYPEAL